MYECKFESILALYVAKEWEETLCRVQNVNSESHKKCSGVHGSLTRKKDFSLEKCISGVLLHDEDKMINLDGDNIKAVDRFFLPRQCTQYGRSSSGGCNIKDGKNLKRFRILYAEKAYR